VAAGTALISRSTPRRALAVGLAGPLLLAAITVHAQSADVTLYGRLNVDVEVVRGEQAPGVNPTMTRVSSNASMFGIRGRETLGGGLAAVFQLESSVSLDSGGGTLAGRESYVGLQGPFGTMRMGNFLAPYDDIHLIFGNAPTFTTSILSTNALWAQGAAGKATGGFDARLPNSVRWDTPALSGFSASAQYSALEAAYPAGVLSVGLFYGNGPLQFGTAYEANHRVRSVTNDDNAFSIAGSYTIGAIDIGAVYEHLRYGTDAGSLKRDLYGVSLTSSIGPGVAFAFIGRAQAGTGSAPVGTRIVGLARGPDTGSTQYEVSYTYELSKRSYVYAGYVRIQNEENASYTFGVNAYPVRIGGKPEGWVLGMVHFF
jgi:predicted porin